MYRCWLCRLYVLRGRGHASPKPRQRRHEEAELMEAGARARRAPVGIAWLQAIKPIASDYVALTKPRVISLLLVTTAATMFVADPSPDMGVLVLTLIGGYLAAGGAGAINHYLERDIDASMTRTSRRPLPAGRI